MTAVATAALRTPPRIDPSRYVPPNWFAAVMGTGIVAVAAATLPWQPPGLRVAAVVVWALTVLLFGVVLTATAAHWIRHRDVARGHHRHPVIAHFYGAPPMAAMTVGAGTLLVGRDVVGVPVAVAVDGVLWTLGTVGGLLTLALVPRAHRRRHPGASPFGGWLMPVVPPMVSASTGALLVPHLDPAWRAPLLVLCYGLFATAAAASTPMIARLVRRLRYDGPDEPAMVPTSWIVLGPLGQAVTAVNLLGAAAPGVVPAPVAAGLHGFGIAFGLPTLALALGWAVFAATVTVRTARVHLPFSLTWWSFTFPVGTVVTGATGLAVRTGDAALRDLAVLLFAALVVAWATVSVRTVRGTVRGGLLLPPGSDASRNPSTAEIPAAGNSNESLQF